MRFGLDGFAYIVYSADVMADSIMVRLPRSLADRVDEVRHATVSREAFVRAAVEAAVKELEKPTSRHHRAGAAT